MRTIKWLVGLAVVGTASGIIASGCGGDDTVVPGKDSGGADHTTDQAAEAATESGADAGPDAPACMTDADLTTLNVPDAQIADSGAFAPSCYACIESTCGSQLSACSSDCECNVGVQGFLSCLQTPGMSGISCGTALAMSTNQNVMNLETCVGGFLAGGMGCGCLIQCGVPCPGMGGEAGVDGATEGGGGEGGVTEGGAGEGGGNDGGGEASADAAKE